MDVRIVLLVTSPRLPAGLLTAEAWDLVRTSKVFAAAETAQSEALRHVGADVTITEHGVDDLLAAAATNGAAVWLSAASGGACRSTRRPAPDPRAAASHA